MSPTPSTASTEQFELAGWGARLAAYTIDQIIRLVLAFVITIAAFVLLADEPFSLPATWDESSFLSAGTEYADYNLIWVVVTAIVVYVLSAFIYAPLSMARWRGATPGKKLLGIRAVHESGKDLSFGQAFVREPLCKGILIEGIGGAFFLVPLVSYLWPLWDRECRAGHDFLVKSRVVRA